MKAKFRWLVLVLLFGLGACGNKGDLYMPTPETNDSAQSEESTDGEG